MRAEVSNGEKEARRANEAKLASLYEEYYDKIARYAYVRIGDRTEAEDIAEEVIQELTRSASILIYQAAALSGGCGFSIIDIGPVIVEQFEFALELVYMSVPCTVQFIDP